jgi:ligand-binding sensor domain-containing protein/signal transduction histidine kinase
MWRFAQAVLLSSQLLWSDLKQTQTKRFLFLRRWADALGSRTTMNNLFLKANVARMCASLLLAISLLGGTVFALDPHRAITQYSHDVWLTKDGLPQSSVQAILQTRDGYLWFGTEEGLVRFDGVRFAVFNTQSGMKHNRIEALYEGNDGSLWISTWNGVTRLQNGKFTDYTTTNGLPGEVILAFCETGDGNLWLGSSSGIKRLKNGQIISYAQKDGFPLSTVSALSKSSDGGLWIGGTGLIKFENERFTRIETGKDFSHNTVTSIHESPNGSLWLGTLGAGLGQLKDGHLTFYTITDGLPDNNVTAICEDKDGNLWIGTSGGFSRFRGGKFLTYSTRDGLLSNRVQSLYQDREGNLWVGTVGGGLNRFADGKLTPFTTAEGLSSNLIRPIIESRDGSLWIGVDNGGLDHFKDGRFISYGAKEGLPEGAVRSICESRDGSLWIGIDGNGLSHFKNGRFKNYTIKDGLNDNTVRSVYETSDGSIWIGTHGLSRFKDGHFTVYTAKDGLRDGNVFAILETKDGKLWIGTATGLDCFEDGRFVHYDTKQGLSNNVILSLYEDKEESLWIGTYGGGLNRLKDGEFTAYTTQTGLFSDVAFTVLEDNNANLWMTCNTGIYRVKKQALDDFDRREISVIPFVSYGMSDGLRSIECNAGSPGGYKTRDGKLWFPTMGGMVMIDPNNMTVNHVAPQMIIEQMLANTQPIDLSLPARLAPGNSDIEFHYTAPSFVSTEKIKFRYKLEGFDKNWIEADSRRIAYYTNLPPGGYRFRVVACNNDGLWNETGASFDFYLRPHFYQTYWFYSLCALALVLSAFSLYRFRVRQLRARNQHLELIVNQRTHELKRSQEEVLKFEKRATERQMAGGFAHEMRNALAGSKLVLDQALALDGPENQVSLSLANCRGLKEIYLGVKDKLPQDDAQIVLSQMQTIFINEERLNDVMQLVRKATRRGLNITQQIMDYSKIGQQQPGRENVNLDQLIENIIDESRTEFLSQGVALEHQADERSASLVGDETHFYSIIKNLMLNARDALIDPGLAGRTDRRIQISTSEEPDACTITIEDNGVGIPQENLPKIFEPFFSTKPASGTGLGLGMVRNMVSLYSGSIDVTSEVSKGTRFTITLPVARQAAKAENLSQ